jgi:Uma2 family endonuclease
MATDTATLTPEALLELPKPAHGKHYELSDGDLIIVGNAGALHELTKTTVFEILTEYRLRTRSGRAFAETQFTLRSDRARIPDVAWVSEGRLVQIPRGNVAIGIAPDIAIEIISDSEQPNEIEQKLRDYMEAGVEVWQIFPSLLGVTIWRGNQGIRLTGIEAVTSEALPGFSVPASEFFR